MCQGKAYQAGGGVRVHAPLGLVLEATLNNKAVMDFMTLMGKEQCYDKLFRENCLLADPGRLSLTLWCRLTSAASQPRFYPVAEPCTHMACPFSQGIR